MLAVAFAALFVVAGQTEPGDVPAPAAPPPAGVTAAPPAADTPPLEPATSTEGLAPSKEVESDDAARSVQAAPAAAPAPAAPRVLVLQPSGARVAAEVREAVASLVAVELGKLPGVDVVSASDVKNLAQLEAEKQTIGCDDDGACLAEIAGALGARFVVFGDAAELGEVTVVNLALFDSTEGRAVGRATIEARGEGALPRRVAVGARALVAGVPAFADRTFPPLPDEKKPLWAIAGAAGLVAAGVVVGGGGVVYDLVADSSDDGVADGLDLIGPGIMVAGVAVIVGGVVLVLTAPEDSS